ncbi:MAG: GNAT family N-acetyltransferase [Chitinophagaceae bacterium]|nr:GNAT family N-acetyltransferase [Chitinophagaceae bacterium]
MMHAFPLIKELSPKLTEEDYRQHISEMVLNGYAQIIAEADHHIIAVSGFWIGTKLYCGRYLEIDNFVVLETHRSQQIGAQMLKLLEEEAIRQNCKVMMLDAYVQNSRAHRFYYRHGFAVKGFHFIRKVIV